MWYITFFFTKIKLNLTVIITFIDFCLFKYGFKYLLILFYEIGFTFCCVNQKSFFKFKVGINDIKLAKVCFIE